MTMSLATYEAIEGSNMPARQKSALRKWYDSRVGGLVGRHAGRITRHATEGLQALRQGGESVVSGAILAAIDVEVGLDVKKVPADLVGGVGLMALGTAMAGHESGLNCDARNVGASALTVFSYRKTYALLHEKKLQAGEKPKGIAAKVAGDIDDGSPEYGEDPIVRAAKNLRK